MDKKVKGRLKAAGITIGTLIGLAILGVGFFMFNPLVFLPHKHIQIILPFDQKYDTETSLIPMGETIFHPKPKSPQGHPGIDFGWTVPVPVISSSDGTVTDIGKHSSDGIDVTVTSGLYRLSYKEMDPTKLGPKIKKWNHISQGDLIGIPNPKYGAGNTPGQGMEHFQVHWEFASSSMLVDRLCPVTYFTPHDQIRINSIWAGVDPHAAQDVKIKFPYICSGDYFGKVEK